MRRNTRAGRSSLSGYGTALRMSCPRKNGVDVWLSQQGGIEYYTDKGALSEYVAELAALRSALNSDYPFYGLDLAELRKYVPEVGCKVIGGLFS